jgi:hypothetical protein
MEVAAKGSDASSAKVEAAIVKVADSNTTVGDSLVELYRNLDFGLYGAHRKLSPDEIKVLEGLGKPIGTTLNSIPDDVKKRG